MTRRFVVQVVLVFALSAAPLAQTLGQPTLPSASRYLDPVAGWSLDQTVAQALAEEPSLRAARSAVDAARGRRLQAALRPNPTFSFLRQEEAGGTDNQTMAGIQWPLDLFRRSARVRVAERQVDVAELELRDRERRLAADVRVAYGQLLASIRQLSILDALIGTLAQQRELLRARVEQGATPPLDRDLLAVEVQRLEAEQLLQSGRVEAALFALKRVVGRPADAPLTVRDELEAIVQRQSVTPAAAVDPLELSNARPDVRALAAEQRLAEARIERAERDGRFDVTLAANYMRMDAGFPQRGFAPDGTLERVRGDFQHDAGGVMVMVPLFNRNQGEIAAARAERAGATASLDAARVAASNEIAAARATDEYAGRAVEAFGRGAVALARQNLAVISETFTLGRVTVFDVLAEQRRYLELERAYTEALAAAFDARTALLLASGELP